MLEPTTMRGMSAADLGPIPGETGPTPADGHPPWGPTLQEGIGWSEEPPSSVHKSHVLGL